MDRQPRQPPLELLRVARFEIEPVTLEGADSAERDWFRDELGAEAAAAAGRLVLQENLAAELSTLPSAARLSGTVEVPTTLPAGVSGSRADFRTGSLARAQLELTGSDGRTLAAAAAKIDWNDVRWTRGSARTRRARPTDAALVDAVDHVLRRAIRQLARKLAL